MKILISVKVTNNYLFIICALTKAGCDADPENTVLQAL